MSGNKKELYRYLLLDALFKFSQGQTKLINRTITDWNLYLYKGKLFHLYIGKLFGYQYKAKILADTTGRYYWQILLADTTGRYYWQIKTSYLYIAI